MIRRSMLLAAALMAVASYASPAYAQLDQVFMGKGAPSRGEIAEMSKEQVTLTMSGVARPFPVNEITRITFGGEPAELNNARNAMAQRNYGQALQELRKLDGQTFERDVIKQDVDFYRAYALARQAMTEGGDKNAATTALMNFARTAPNNYHFYEAAETLGDLAVSSGKFAEAAKYYGPIASAPWPDYQMRANNAIGRALLAQKQIPEAQQKFEAVLASELTTAEASKQKQLATVGRAVCLAESGKAEEGITILQEIIANNDAQDTTLFARTYNALGNCYLKLNKPKDALQAFLHTDVLFHGDQEAHAEALYRLSKLWNDVNKSDRAVEARSLLRDRYAGSVWASLE